MLDVLVFGILEISLTWGLASIKGDWLFRRVLEVYDIFLTNLLNIVAMVVICGDIGGMVELANCDNLWFFQKKRYEEGEKKKEKNFHG